MSNERQTPAHKLHVAILHLLLAARKKNPHRGGASGKQLLERLNLESIDALREALMFLTDNQLVEAGDRNFQITAAGVDYLEDNPPSDTQEPPKPPQSPPWSPGDPPGPWPPKSDPDDPARMPRRRKPSDGAGAIGLPLPDQQTEQT